MAQSHQCSVVFVGDDFPPATFDERALFGGRLDPEHIRVGPVAQFSYASNRYRFEVGPNRIDIKENAAPSILSDELLEAACAIAKVLTPIRRAIPVTAVGMNCDSVFRSREIGRNGTTFCSRLMSNAAPAFFGTPVIQPFMRARLLQSTLTFDVRVEPHLLSSGEDLFIAVNGQDDVAADKPLHQSLAKAPAFRDYVLGLHQRINTTMKETAS